MPRQWRASHAVVSRQSRASRAVVEAESVQLTLHLGDEPGEPGERPTGLPEMTGVERMRGVKDPVLVSAFVAAAHGA